MKNHDMYTVFIISSHVSTESSQGKCLNSAKYDEQLKSVLNTQTASRLG